MKRYLIGILGLILISGLVIALPTKTPQTLVWDASVDGTITGYNIYWSQTAGSYNDAQKADVGKVTTVPIFNVLPITPPPKGKYFFVATAYNVAKIESGFSNEVFWDAPIEGPKNLKVQ